MCLAVPAKVISIHNDMATIDVYGARKDVSIILLSDEPGIGDYVLVHAGFAIQSIKAEVFQTGEIMHESSIAHSILEIVDEQCREQGCTTVESIIVRLGKATGVMPESLQFAFDALKEPTVAKDATMTIEMPCRDIVVLYCWRVMNCRPWRASSRRMSSAMMPPNTKTTSAAAMYCTPTTLWSTSKEK